MVDPSATPALLGRAAFSQWLYATSTLTALASGSFAIITSRRKGNEIMDFVIESHMANGKLLFDRVHGVSNGPPSEPEAISPPVDVVENREGYRFSIELPGLKSDSLEVKVEDETLVINAERDEPVWGKDAQVHRAERHYGRIHRHFELPSDVGHDGIKAAYKDGVRSRHRRGRRELVVLAMNLAGLAIEEGNVEGGTTMAETKTQAARRRGANLQRRRTDGHWSIQSGEVSHTNAALAHIAPQGVKDWQPLCGAPLGTDREFDTSSVAAMAPLCPKCQEIEKARH